MPSIVSFYHMFVYYVNLWVIMKGGLCSKHVTDFGDIILYGKGNFEAFTHVEINHHTQMQLHGQNLSLS